MGHLNNVLVFEFPTCCQNTPKKEDSSLYHLTICFYCTLLLVAIIFEMVSEKVVLCKKECGKIQKCYQNQYVSSIKYE